jgi:hypothetical protein
MGIAICFGYCCALDVGRLTMKYLRMGSLAAVLLLFLPVLAKATIISVSWNGTVSSIDGANGTGVLIGHSGFYNLNSLARNSSGILYSVAGGSPLVTIDPNTGLVEDVMTTTLSSVRGLAFSRDDVLFAVENGGGPENTVEPDDLFTIDVSTGVATWIGNTGFPGIQGLAFSPNGALYGWDVFDGLLMIDPLTGAATDVNISVGGLRGIQTLDFAPGNDLYGARESLFTIDIATGIPAVVGGGGYSDVRGIAFTDGIHTPEPSTSILIASGLLGLLGIFRHRRKGK